MKTDVMAFHKRLGLSFSFILLVCSGFLAPGQTTTAPTPSSSPYPSSNSSLSCDFEDVENPFCNWKAVSQSWSVAAARDMPAIRSSSYPFTDHTMGNIFGHYAYIKSSYANRHQATFTLMSPRIVIPETGICFQFWYRMYGSDINDLQVFVKQTVNTTGKFESRDVWLKSGSQGFDWRRGQIHIPDMTGEAYIEVKIVVKRRSRSYPELDDVSIHDGHCPTSDLCDFEDGYLCSYTQTTSDDFDWGLSHSQNSQTSTKKKIPKTDHTFGTSVGHYAYIEASHPRISGDKSLLETNSFPATTQSCLSFWYAMDGVGIGTLNARIKTSSSPLEGSKNKVVDKLLFTKSGDQGVGWFLANVGVSSSVEYLIIFEGIVGKANSHHRIAIDDIRVKAGFCPEQNSCDFEEHTCTWRNMPGEQAVDWERVTTKMVSYTSPKFDHTLHTRSGHYLYFNSRDLRTGDVAKISSPTLDKGKIYCLNFWYNAGTQANFTIITRDVVTGIENEVSFNKTYGAARPWYLLRKTLLPFKNNFNVLLVATRTVRGRTYGNVCVDDVAVQEGSCAKTPSPQQTRNAFKCPEGKFLSKQELCDFHRDCQNGEDEQECGYDCDFEKRSTCGWRNSEDKRHFFRLETGEEYGGPHLDHTTNTVKGHYLRLKGERRSREPARLLSPLFQKSASNCEMVFYLFYHNVTRQDITVTKLLATEKTELFRPGPSSNVNMKWQEVILPLGATEVPFRIEISDVTFMDSGALIGLDDIFFRNCDFPQPQASCVGTNTFKCNNQACVHPSLLCNYVDDCGDGSDETTKNCASFHTCGFESGLCEWSQETEEDDYDWELQDAGSSKGTKTDHTTSLETGHYLTLVLNPRSRLPGDKAWLVSPVLKPTSDCAMALYLYMGKSVIQDFYVYTRTETRGPLVKVFSNDGMITHLWIPVYLRFKSSTEFQIILEGRFGKTAHGEIVLDDIVLSPSCIISSNPLPVSKSGTLSTTPSPCGDVGKWQCADGSRCIYRLEVCDFVSQCQDGSDEKDCGACDFESSMCGWRDRTRGRYVWTRVNSSSSDASIKPVGRHTHDGERVGTYVQVHSKGFGYTRPASLESPLYGSTEPGCFIEFYYKAARGSTQFELMIFTKDITSYEDWKNGGSRISFLRHYGHSWYKSRADIGARSAGFRLVFTFKFYQQPKESDTGPAIDDISFSPDCGIGKTSTSCKPREFMCQQSRECKPISARCDRARDCKHGEDEEACGEYLISDFEELTDEKTFTDDFRDISLYWSRLQPSSSTDEYAPDQDHTFGNTTGHYMYIERGVSDSMAVARLKGPVMIGNKEGSCYMRMFYHLNWNYTKGISVYTETHEGGVLKPVWSANNEEGNEWKKANIRLEEPILFRVIIEGVRGADYKGDMAIDDISFTPQCVKSRSSLPPYFPRPFPGSCKKDVEFPCDGKCTSINKWCDFNADCQDNADERVCPSTCDFEGGMCGWVARDSKSSLDLKLIRVQSGNDHRPGKSTGHVLMLHSFTYYKRTGYLTSPYFRAASDNCTFSMWHKGGSLNLDINTRSNGVEEKVFSERFHKNDTHWRQVSILLPPCQHDFQLELELRVSRGDIPLLLDDFSFSGCGINPPTERCQPGEFTCKSGLCVPEDTACDLNDDCCDGSDEDAVLCRNYRKNTFEHDMGGWKQKTGVGTWSRETSVYYLDHTFYTHRGHWIIAKCRGIQNKIVVEHEMPLPNEACVIHFWYSFLQTDANITVYVKPLLGESSLVATFESSTDTMKVWSRADVKIDAHERYLLVLEGACSNRYGLGIAIDDITFSPSCGFTQTNPQPTSTFTPTTKRTIFASCPNVDQFQCVSNGVCIPSSQVCNFNIDCADQSDETGCNTISTCDFDDDLCDWQETAPDNLDWVRGSTSDLSTNQGPGFDAGGTSGHYVYVKSPNKAILKTQIASLGRRDISSAAAGCAIEFYYFLWGPDTGTLSLRIIYGVDGEGTTLWKTDKQSDSWVKVIVGIGHRTSTFSLAFIREPESGSFSEQMALDKIKFSSSCMQLPVEEEKCPNEQKMYRCACGACVKNSQLCDGQDDCGDGSDESNHQCEHYSRENFESLTSPLGSLSQSSDDDDLDWSLWKSSVDIPEGLLGVDHSTGLPEGHYLYVTGNSLTKRHDSAWLLSKPFKATAAGKGCEIRFFALIPSAEQTLQVGTRAYNSSDESVTFVNTDVKVFGSYWQQVALTLEGMPRPFQIVFKASPGQPNGSLAIDDVTFGPHCRPIDSVLRSMESSGSDSDGEWRTAVGVVVGLVGTAALVAGIGFYLYRTGKIDGIRVRFQRFGDRQPVVAGTGRFDQDSVYYDGRGEVNVKN